METPEVLKGRSAAAIDMVGCSNTESAALLKCLQALPAALLVNTTHTFEASITYEGLTGRNVIFQEPSLGLLVILC